MITLINLTGELVTLEASSNLFVLPAGAVTVPAPAGDWVVSITNGSSFTVPVSGQPVFASVYIYRIGTAVHGDVVEQMGVAAAWSYGFSFMSVICLAVMAFRHFRKVENPTTEM